MRLAVLGLLLPAACSFVPRSPAPGLERVAADLDRYVERQRDAMGIPGIAVAILDRDPITGEERSWQAGFGELGPGRGPLPADAVARVASVSKLFTATAAMVLVEQGRLDLDAPLQRYLPEFAPANPFGVEVTVRHLLGHRGGVVREGPVGHYFDPTAPTAAAMVASLAQTSLVHAPGSAFKYSNPGVGVVGEVIARITGQPFETAVRDLVLAPLGLADSDFTARPDLVARTAAGVMWTYDGRAIPTPDFPFGYPAAANLRSTVGDLVGFARSWLPNAPQRVLRPASLAAMWALPDGQARGCGIGFFVGRTTDGVLQVQHGGAVYGFATELRAWPELGLAAAVVCTKDFANEVAEAIAGRALAAALANRRGEALPAPVFPEPIGAADARLLAGHYRVGEFRVDLLARGDELVYDPDVGLRTRLRRAADGAFVADDPLAVDSARRLVMKADGTLHDGEAAYRRDDELPSPPPAELRPLLGEYGWDHDVLVVYEDHGRLAVLIEWVVREVPEPEGPDRFRFPAGMYGGDQLVFERDAAGNVVAAVVGGARFRRRPDPVPGAFRITPVRPIAELRAAAALAQPPVQPPGLLTPDLVDLAVAVPGLQFDLRYATADNFLGVAVYPVAKAMLQRPAAAALGRAHAALAAHGFGIRVFDAYRPWAVTKVFWEATPPELRHFVADPATGSRHNRGCAVDVTLYDLATGQPVEMPSGFDEFTPRAYPDYPGGTSRQRACRELLRRAMEGAGFAVYEHEWWHFDFRDWRRYPVANVPLAGG